MTLADFENTSLIIAAIVGALALLFLVMYVGSHVSLWLQAWLSDAPVAFTELIGMRFRKVDPRIIVLSRIRAVKAGLRISTAQLETHYLCRGNVSVVVTAMIEAYDAQIELPWDTCCAIDLAGRDVLKAVQASINSNSKVVDFPET